jgi:hypothetical protein
LHPLAWIGVGLAGAEGLVNLGLLLYILFSRATFPLDLEWMEGGMLCHALRIMQGQPLYAPPSADFISFLYPPGYPFLLAVLGKLVGLSYTLGRVTSAVCILSAMTLVFLAVRRETGSKQGSLWGLAAVGLIAVIVGRWIRQRSLPRTDNGPLYWYLMAFVGVLCSAVGHATAWAYTNAFIPGFFFLAAFAPMASADLLRRSEGRLKRPLHVGILTLALGLAITAQMRFQALDPEKYIPTDQNRKNGQALIAYLRKLEGPMLMPYHPYYPVLAGKRPGFHNMSLKDITAAGMAMPADLTRRLREHYYRAIILDHEPTGDHAYILPSYKLGSELARHEMPRVLTGYDSFPLFVYVPRLPDPVPEGARRVFGFEDGTYRGWTVKGRAFGDAPAGGSLKGQNPVGPFGGAYLANSFHGGDAATGSMMSPEFLVDRPLLSYRIGGGRDIERVFLRLLVEGREVHRATGVESEAPAVRRVEVQDYMGKMMRVVLVDSSGAGWGHLLFDDLMLLRQ